MPARALVAPLAAIDALRQSGRSVGDGEAAAVLRLSAEYAEGAALLRRLRADGVRLGTCSYAALLEGCARRGEPEYAEAVLAEMQAKGIPQLPDGAMQLLLLRAHATARDSAGCSAVLDKLRKGQAPSLPRSLTEAYQIQMTACEADCHPRGNPAQAVRIASDVLDAAVSDGVAEPSLWAGALAVSEAAADVEFYQYVAARMGEGQVRWTELARAVRERMEQHIEESSVGSDPGIVSVEEGTSASAYSDADGVLSDGG
eukprot:TRINITY_DN20346_c0_g1_i1.p2 TRINITY_DN20346_c0_g1~~TRINITY_DN20346_c0_g1_i1.p2  ORF type:complete len:258 (+),score=96.71 TRINITY_DN20346_c0_g1_i1:65-838(+)